MTAQLSWPDRQVWTVDDLLPLLPVEVRPAELVGPRRRD